MPPFPPSQRGQKNVKPDLMIDLSRRVEENAYDKKSNPDGIIDLGSATNDLMKKDLARWIKKHETEDDRQRYLRYNDTQFSPDLPAAAASFLNQFFHPSTPLKPTNVLVGNGLTALLDTLFFNLADTDSAILVPTPSYGMFSHDLSTRNGLHLVPVPCDDITLARFRQHIRPGRPPPELLDRLATAAILQRQLGRKVAAVLIANPENPLGCCYSREMLRWLVKWCEAEGAHLVVDEIYALSGGDNFTSVLSLELGDMLQNVHVLWGMSKDFGLGGLRIGFLVTHHEALYRAMRTCSMFTWVSAYSGNVSTKLLTDKAYVSQTFLPKLRTLLNKRLNSLLAILDELNIPYTTPDAAFFVFIDLSRWLSNFTSSTESDPEMTMVEYLIRQGIFLEPGKAFFSAFPGYFRLNYGSEEGVFRLGLSRLIAALGALDGKTDTSQRCTNLSIHPSSGRFGWMSCFRPED